MYASLFGLNKEPFRMTPDPALVYMTPAHRDALVGLSFSVLTQKGFVLLTGDAGTGKTTVLARFLNHLPPRRVVASVVFNPTLDTAEFLELVLMNFGVKQIPSSKAQRLGILHGYLLEAEASGQIPLLVIDEAHKLSTDVLEEVRLLGNFETPEKKLLQIVLAGQSELCDTMNRADLWQFKQRFSVRLQVKRLSREDVAEYILFRWNKSGGGASPFTPAAIDKIAQASEGIPRIVNAICDNALIWAVANGRKQVFEDDVSGVLVELDLKVPVAAAEVAVAGAAPAEPPAKTAPAPAAPVVHTEQAAAAAREYSDGLPLLQTLERYEERDSKRSFFRRLVGLAPALSSK